MYICHSLKHKQMKTIAEQLNVTQFPFIIKDKQGNKIYYETSDASWYKREYDNQRNVIYYETSDGYWYKREYDNQGNDIYYEASNGFWYKREYDNQGNDIYYENSNGLIKDNRKKKIVIDGKEIELSNESFEALKKSLCQDIDQD